MWQSFWSHLALAAVSFFSSAIAADEAKPDGQSNLILDDKALAFAFTVPDTGTADMFFSLRVKRGYSWGAIGLGSDDMAGALYLMIYENAKGDNVTFSPRLGYGNYEPYYYEDMDYEILNGTGLFDEYMVVYVHCLSHCRSWPGHHTGRGFIDVSSDNQPGIFALGPKQGFGSDNPAKSIKYHARYGQFTMDMKRTRGVADAPLLRDDSEMAGASVASDSRGKSDWKSIMHAVFMIIFLAVMMPVGGVLLRLGVAVRWHAINQTVALIGVFAGFAMGILTSFNYQRSRGFNSGHQVLGYIIIAFLIGQFGLGFFGHKQYKRTQQPSKLAPWHKWFGRAILFLGIVNSFFGLRFALNRKYGMALATAILMIVIMAFTVSFLRSRKARGHRSVNGASGQPTNTENQPWRQPPPPNQSAYPSDPPPGYQPPSDQDRIGLRPVSPWQQSSSRKDDDYDTPDLGTPQQPREFT